MTGMMALKTVRRDEPISRSRFADCPVCKNHTLKVKRTVQVGRCKSCSETYKVVVVFVRSRGSKPTILGAEKKQEIVLPKSETVAESPTAILPQPADTGLVDSTSPDYSGLAEALFGPTTEKRSSETGQSSQ